MKGRVTFGNSIITYSVTKSNRRKTSEIIVDVNGVEIKTPLSKKDSEIKQIISNKKEWIFKKQLEFSNRKKRRVKSKEKTAKYLEDRTWKLATRLGVKPSKVSIKNMRTRWGSSTKSGIITLNRAIARAPPRVIDYVILHELCHLKIPDHSSRFWSLLYAHDKKFEENKKWLDRHDLSIVS